MRSGRADWVGGFPCRGQEAPQRALSGSVDDARRPVKRRVSLHPARRSRQARAWTRQRFARREDFDFGRKPAISMRSAWDRLRAIFSMMS